MLLPDLRRAVLDANLELVRRGLVLYTFGNASGIDRDRGLVVIKPSGVPYEQMTPEMLVVVDLDGRPVEGSLRPSSDLPTHLVLYRAFTGIGGVVHTHSGNATAWCQAGRELPCFGTTHADYCHGPVPVTQPLSRSQVEGDYEAETGIQIVQALAGLDPRAVPMVLVHGHAPFTWGKDAAQAAYHAVVLEELARMATATLTINPKALPLAEVVRDKHYLRKHGPKATYGQR